MRKRIIAASLVVFTAIVSSAAASDGEIVITHGKALAGDVTPGDAPGYPVTISQTGSYKLGSVIHPSANTIGIAVIAPDVTIDLNGFRMHGSTTAFFGITGKLMIEEKTAKLGSAATTRSDVARDFFMMSRSAMATCCCSCNESSLMTFVGRSTNAYVTSFARPPSF